MSEQASLLSLFEQQFAEAFPADDRRHTAPRAAAEPNPFRKQFGSCCGQENVRVFWCWKCAKVIGCWNCFEKHKD